MPDRLFAVARLAGVVLGKERYLARAAAAASTAAAPAAAARRHAVNARHRLPDPPPYDMPYPR